jgi:nucleoside phosphorylase
VVLVTATETEKEELRAQLAARDANASELRGSRFTYRRAQIGAWRIAALHVEIGIFGDRGALARCAVARDETLAMLFVAVGTAFGIPRVAGLGDVLVSDAVLFYDDRQPSRRACATSSPARWRAARPSVCAPARATRGGTGSSSPP